jgi:hypothetical protein
MLRQLIELYPTASPPLSQLLPSHPFLVDTNVCPFLVDMSVCPHPQVDFYQPDSHLKSQDGYKTNLGPMYTPI